MSYVKYCTVYQQIFERPSNHDLQEDGHLN